MSDTSLSKPVTDRTAGDPGRSGVTPAGGAPSRLGVALVVISAAQLMVVLDASIVNIALPYVQTDLGFSPENLSWIVNAYTLAFGGLLLLGGRLGDLLGRRRMFMVGVGVFALASLLGGLATGETTLISARVLQGVGAAIASPTALALITTTFPAGAARNRAFGIYAAMSGAGAAVGLILGGALTEASWRWTFFINVPIGLLVLFMAPRVLPESVKGDGHFDIPGAVTATAGLASLVYGLTQAVNGWGRVQTLGWIIAGVVLIAAFLVIETRSAHPLMPMRVLRNRNRAVSYLAMLATGSALFAMFYFLSLYVQQVLGYSAITTGVSFLPFAIGIGISAQVAGKLITLVDPRFVSASGGAMAAVGLLWMSQLEVGSSYFPHLFGPMVVIALGLGLTFVPLTLTAVSGVEKEDSGVASAVLNTMQQVGGALGLSLLATVAASASRNSSALTSGAQPRLAALQAAVDGYTSAFTTGAVITAVAAVVVLVGLNISKTELSPDQESPVHVG
ncbi:MFS transporter [Rhodococcus antarcticus]|uniref:MFS transporter n=1 Tax=Rhodococcus antarcticus TaxID=2987751 RepID=A0ABY6P2C2_9NOCA|nr:MFS transporter [Rhodococcus antarcticus]UZJ25795.1 MFS transporter [Rhodococcus antarcticus]